MRGTVQHRAASADDYDELPQGVEGLRSRSPIMVGGKDFVTFHLRHPNAVMCRESITHAYSC